MRQQTGAIQVRVGVREVFRPEPVVAALMVLEPEVARAVRKREEKIVVSVVARAEERLGLGGERAVAGELLVGDDEIFRAVSNDV